MRTALGTLPWSMARRPAAAAWAAFLAWETFGFRSAIGVEFTGPGVADDLAAGGLLLALLHATEALPRLLRAPLLLVVGLAVGVFCMFNAAYYSFFGALLNADSYLQLTQVSGAATSVDAVLTQRLVVLHAVIPGVLLLVAWWASLHPRRRKLTAVLPGALLLAALSGGAWMHARHDAFIIGERNGIMTVARQVAHRLYVKLATSPTTRNREILTTLPDTYIMPDSTHWQVGTDPAHPLLRVPTNPQDRPSRPHNIVVVLLESFRLAETSIGKDQPGFTPNLWKLAREGLYAANFYANGHQRVRGESATLCSLLPQYGAGTVYDLFPALNVRCLPEVLRDAGYRTHWISSYTVQYGNKFRFLSQHGFTDFHDDKGMKGRKLIKPRVGWGPSDEDLVDYALDELDKSRQPFFAEIMTLSSHHPFEGDFGIPDPPEATRSTERTDFKRYITARAYVDLAIGRLVERARSRPWFDDTVFLILGDHGMWLFPEKLPRPLRPEEKVEAYFRVPFIAWSPKHIAPRVLHEVTSQVDVAPTVLDLIGLDSANSFQGVSMLYPLPPGSRMAVMGNENAWNIRQGNTYCYVTGQTCSGSVYCDAVSGTAAGGHRCFEYDGDLLDHDHVPEVLPSPEPGPALQLLERGQRIVDNNDYLHLVDSLFPAALRADVKPPLPPR